MVISELIIDSLNLKSSIHFIYILLNIKMDYFFFFNIY